MLKKYLAVLCFGVMSCSAANAVNPNKEFADFFAQYEKLSNADDPKGAALYADDAKITIDSISPDGIIYSMRMSGKKLKESYLENIDTIRQMGAKSTYNKLKIDKKGDTAKITASRYDNLECFSDNDYYMVVSRKIDKKLYITEEYSTLSEQSFCKEGIKDNLALQLTLSASMLNKNLPMQIDTDTRLEHVESKDKEITFTHQLIHFKVSELNRDKVEMNLVPEILKQSCKNSGIKNMLNQGALIRLKYLDKDGLPFIQINVTKKDCE